MVYDESLIWQRTLSLMHRQRGGVCCLLFHLCHHIQSEFIAIGSFRALWRVEMSTARDTGMLKQQSPEERGKT